MAADSTGPIGSVAVVGASVAGLHAVEQLRARGYTGKITLVGDEPHLPYDRPPLSKQVLLGTFDRTRITLRTPAELDSLGVDLRLGCRAVGWDGGALALDGGAAVTADRLIVATGVRARVLPAQPDHPAIGTLRTMDDAEWLAARLRRGGPVAVIGGGFIGAEVASAARRLGCPAVMFEATALPMQRVLGPEAAGLLSEVLAGAGVDYRGATPVHALVPDGDAVRIESDGITVRADTVVVGIGTVPQSSWLDGPDPVGTGGIACDGRGRALGIANAYAVGDVAAWPDPHSPVPTRIEHWTSARTQAATVAADITGCAPPGRAEPDYFWSDQFGLKIQVVGHPEPADRTVLLRPEDGGVPRSVVLYLRGGALVACALFSAARLLAPATGLVAAGATEADARAALGQPGR